EVMGRLGPYCHCIEVVGSIRRQKDEIRDIDIVLIPANPGQLSQEIDRLGSPIKDGEKLRRVNYKGTQVDIYYATLQTWATLLLIRTGSKLSNICLCSLAKKKGWHLAANGDGLFNENRERVAGDSEESIYEALGLEYKEPWERE
ncbi:unnamed protein product, partial [marine sediment metagenome]